MSTVQIVGKEYYLKNIFGDGFRFFIPRYQRPYSWTMEQTEELADDLWSAFTADEQEVAKKDPYFLGSIVLIKDEHQPISEVIDGQQRITTLTILLSALRHLQPAGADAISDYLRQKGKVFEGMKDEFRLTLRPQDAEIFETHIQREKGIGALEFMNPASLRNDAQRNVRANALYLVRRLKEKPPEQLPLFTQFILTKCILVVVSTPDMDSAYRIFSVMNDRGLDLSHSDILKADVIGKISGEANQGAYGKKWESAEENLGREAFDDLFAHIRMIHVKQKMRTTILKELRDFVKPSAEPTRFIDEQLVPYANALATVKAADYRSAQGAEAVNGYLKWLNRIENFDWIPPALIALAKHGNEPEWLARFFRELERLAAGMMVMRYGTNDRLERYGKVLGFLQAGDDDALYGNLALTEAEKRIFLDGLNGNLYELTRVRAYVLLRLDTALSGGGASYDYPIISIEHVLPQTPKKGSKWFGWFPEELDREGWVHRLANLVLLSQKKNSEAQNFEFDVKKEKYFKSDKGISPFVLTTQVIRHTEWTPTVLNARQGELLAKLTDLWSLQAWDTDDDRAIQGQVTLPSQQPQTPNRKSVPERFDIRERFWTGLLEVAARKTTLHANVSPGQYGWIGAGSGRRGLGLVYAVREHHTQVELYIDRGKDRDRENKAIFDQLLAKRAEIEKVFGDELEWQRLDARRACRVRKVLDLGGYRDAEKWPAIHVATSDAMARMERAMKPAIQALEI